MFIAYPTGVMLAEMRRSDFKNEARLCLIVSRIVQGSEADSTSFVKHQSERGGATAAKPKITDQEIRHAIRPCRPNPQAKDSPDILLPERP
jgi:hypothetical protein